MQFKLAALATISAATLATATGGSDSQCNAGSILCCNTVGTANSAPISALLVLLGINVASVTGLVGVTCTPVTIIGTGGTPCSAQLACCTNNSFNGVVALGCTPININL